MAAPPFIARRSPVLARHGMVACTQPLAAEAGLAILKRGGNAADAAVAVAAAMAVTEPCSTGLGGDAFALYYDAGSRTVAGLNGSGRSAAAASLDAGAALARGADRLPERHGACVTVPGAAAAWCDAAAAWGTLPLATLLAPAVALAEDGFPVAPLTAHHWADGVPVLAAHAAVPHCDASALLLEGGRAPSAGEVFANLALAATLRELGTGGAAAFYRGRVGAAIVAATRAAGGWLTANDLAAHATEFVTPISTVYRGVRVWEIPPNGQGLTALLALNIMTALPPSWYAAAADAAPGGAAAAGSGGAHSPPVAPYLASPFAAPAAAAPLAAAGVQHGSYAHMHTTIDALRLAFADTRWYVADATVPAASAASVDALLAPSYAASRAGSMLPSAAATGAARGTPTAACDTVSFQVVDAAGNAASFINSNYMGFGTGIVPAGTGFSLQNRGANFSLAAGHPNALAPAKRPYHTIIPGMATWDDTAELYASFSVMGGFMQPQGHVQVLSAMLDFGLDPQTALDAPRFCITDGTAGGTVALEDGMPPATAARLAAAGHPTEAALRTGFARALFGRGQIIARDRRNGVLWGASDGRGDGCALGW